MSSALMTRGLSWLVTLGVARAFESSQFGLIAICWTVHNAAVLVRDQAVTSTIVVATEDTTLRDTVFALTMAISLVVGGGVVILGQPVSDLVGLDAGPLLMLFAAAFVVSALGAVPTGLLQRSLRFRSIALVEIASTITYVTVTLTLIATGSGPEAVGWGQLVGAGVGTLGIWVASRYRPTRRISIRAFRPVAAYSGGTVAIAVLSFAFANVDTLWVAARTSADQLGVYALAFNIAFVFAMTLTQVIQKVVFSTHATVLDDPKAGRRLLLESERLVLAASLPMAWGVVMFGPEMIERVFGAKYFGAAGPLRILALYGLLAGVGAAAASYLRACGRLKIIIVALGVQLAAGNAGLALTIGRGGITAAAASVCVAVAIGTAMVVISAFRVARAPVSAWRAVVPSPLSTGGLAVPLVVLCIYGERPITFAVATVGLFVYVFGLWRPWTRLRGKPTVERRLPSDRPLHDVAILGSGVIGAVVVGAIVALAPATVLSLAIVPPLAWVASSRMRQATLIAVALAPTLPIGLFIVATPSLPLVTAARAVVAILVIGGALAVVRGRLRIRSWSLWSALVLWLVAVAASVPDSINGATSVQRFMSELFETAAFAGIVYCVFDRETYRQVLRVLTVGAAVGSAIAVLQVLRVDLLAGVRARAGSVSGRGNSLVDTGDVRLGFTRAQGAFQTPSFLGASMAMALPVAYALFITERRRLWAICTALIGAGLFVSVTRATWLVAIVTVAGVVLVASRRGFRSLHHLYLMCAAMVLAAIAVPSSTSRVFALISELTATRADSTTTTTNFRVYLHERVIEVARARPWTGYGSGTFDQIDIRGVNRGLVVSLKSADSHLLRLLAEVGLFGCAAFAVLMISVVVALLRLRRGASHSDQVMFFAVTGAAVGFIAVNLTISAFAIAQCGFFFWAMVAATCSAATSHVSPQGVATHTTTQAFAVQGAAA